ncbi:MAG: hypothetical protein KME55_10680 [Nostoc indistinguendum CM1-VF10]|nr:hypothetical protein [Nostoc indistinguendum CM1-VF10]
MSNNKRREDSKCLRFALPCLCATRPVILNKILTIDDIDIPGLTINS